MKKVLFVIDMQNDFISGVLGSKSAKAIVQPVIKKIEEYKSGDNKVIATMDTHFNELALDEYISQKAFFSMFEGSGYRISLPLIGSISEAKKIKLYKESQEGKLLPIEHCIRGSAGWDIDENVMCALPETTLFLEKLAFAPKDISDIKELILPREENIEIELVGLCTDVCVISTAMALKCTFPEIKISVYSDACAGTTEESHNNALAAMNACQIIIK